MKRTFATLLVSAASLTALNSWGLDLSTAYEKALRYDSELAAAQAGRNADAENVIRSRAGLLPTVGVGGSYSHIDAATDLRNSLIDSSDDSDDSYSQLIARLELRQALFEANTYYNFRANEFARNSADESLRSAKLSLIFRTSDAYFGVLRAWDNLKTAERAEQAFKRQWEQAKERFEVGLIAITEVHESKAIYDSGKVTRINAQGQLDIALESLNRITGDFAVSVNQLSESYEAGMVTPADLGHWEATANNYQPAILGAQWDVQNARSIVSARKAEHLPTVDATASYGYSDATGPSVDGTSNDTRISLNFNLPLYAGGATQSGVRQANFLLQQAEQILLTSKRNTLLELRSRFRSIRTDIESIQARRQEIISNKSALDATRAGYDVGTRNIVEVLDAERKYFQSLSDYSNARYDYILNLLSFKQTAGVISVEDIKELNKWLDKEISVSS